MYKQFVKDSNYIMSIVVNLGLLGLGASAAAFADSFITWEWRVLNLQYMRFNIVCLVLISPMLIHWYRNKDR